MKVINIFVNSFPKISETFIYNKVKSLLENGFKVNIIVSHNDNDSSFFKSLNHFSNFNQVVAPINKVKNFKINISIIFSFDFYKILLKNKFKLRKTYKEFLYTKTLNLYSPDIIHFEFSGIGFQYIPYLKNLKDIKVGASFRGASEKIKPLIDNERYEFFPIFLELLDYYHCVSNNMVDELEKFQMDPLKVNVIYPSIDINKFNYLDDYSASFKVGIKIISVGRLHWKKGIDLALLALQKLKINGYKFEYTIVGNGDEFEKLKFMASNLDLKNEVIFLGYKDANIVSELLKKSQLFLLPSYSEGLSNSALEAMCTGIPIISAKAGGMDEAIIHMENGLLFEIGDINTLYANLKYIMDKKVDLNRLRFKASETIKSKFSLKDQNESFRKLYNRL